MISNQASHSRLYNLNHIHNIYLATLSLLIILLINVTYPSIYFVKDIGGYLRENSLFNNPVETAFVNGYLFVSATYILSLWIYNPNGWLNIKSY